MRSQIALKEDSITERKQNPVLNCVWRTFKYSSLNMSFSLGDVSLQTKTICCIQKRALQTKKTIMWLVTKYNQIGVNHLLFNKTRLKRQDSIKEIFSDSNNFFLWHESKDKNRKSLFSKFQLITILRFQVMHNYVCFIVPTDYCVENILVSENFF